MTAFQHAYTMLAFIIGWVIFRADNMTYATKYIRVMFGMKHTDMLYKINYFIGSYEILIFVIGIVCAMPIFKNLVLPDDTRKPTYKLALNTYLIGLFIISTAAIAASTYNPFIYFRFWQQIVYICTWQIFYCKKIFSRYNLPVIGVSSNGRTRDFGSLYHGSNPCAPTKIQKMPIGAFFIWNTRIWRVRKSIFLFLTPIWHFRTF